MKLPSTSIILTLFLTVRYVHSLPSKELDERIPKPKLCPCNIAIDKLEFWHCHSDAVSDSCCEKVDETACNLIHLVR